MSRIQATFERLARERRKALIPYVTAGDPKPDVTVPLMHALAKAGADVIELGVPFSDPMADGPVIQRSGERALKHRVGLDRVVTFVAEFRRTNSTTPVVLMGYANPIEAMGLEAFVEAGARAGVDGVLVVDYPPEESKDFAAMLRAQGMDMIFLLAPTSTEARIEQVARLASGYVYYVSLRGVTGAKHLDLDDVSARLPAIRNKTRLPIGVGFGIRDGERGGARGRRGRDRQPHHPGNGAGDARDLRGKGRRVSQTDPGSDGRMSWLQKLLPPKINRTGTGAKKNVPEGLWSKCPSCAAVLYATDLEKNANVCPKCGYHNRISARGRLDLLLDPEGRFEIGVEVASVDSLKFKDDKRYPDRLEEAEKATGETEALVVMQGAIKNVPLIVAAFEFEFMGGSMGSAVGERFVRGVHACLDQQ